MSDWQHKPDVFGCFTRYVTLRNEGCSQEQALESLQAAVAMLSEAHRLGLKSMIRAWEVHAGQEAVLPRVGGQPRLSESQTTASDTVTCPYCQKPNQKQEYYCYACGHILPGAPETRNLGDDFASLDPSVRWGTSFFDSTMALVLEPRGSDTPLIIYPGAQPEMTIGRIAPGTSTLPDIDLADYGAEEHGVSRLHAALRCRENTLTIRDLGSSNYTFVNGQRLQPGEPRCLRDGDEVRMGFLVLRVRFRRRQP